MIEEKLFRIFSRTPRFIMLKQRSLGNTLNEQFELNLKKKVRIRILAKIVRTWFAM